MRTQPPEIRRVALTLVFALVCVGLLIAGWLSFGGSVPLEPEGYRVTMRFDEARSVLAGSDVQVSGVRVGHVTDVKTAGGDADVTIQLDNRYVPLRAGATAIIRTKTLLGEGYVELGFGPKDARPIPEGGRLPDGQTRDNQQLDEFLATFSPRTRAHTRSLFGGLARAFDGRATDFGDAIGVAGPAAANVHAVLGILDAQRPQLQRLLNNSGDVLSAIGDREGSLQAGLAAGNRFLAATGSERAALRATVRALPPFLGKLRTASATLEAAGPDLARSMTALQTVSPEVAPALAAIDRHGPAFERLFGELRPTLRTAIDRLPLVERITRSAAPALHQVYPATRDLIPTIGLLAADRLDAIGILANITSITNGVGVGPGGKLLPQGTGLPTLWNEVIGGYKKKLPTNRPNPYPKPGALYLKPRGYLQSFQCSHTGNPLLVPPFGSVPPCSVQGPWHFNGHDAYYPNMHRAAP